MRITEYLTDISEILNWSIFLVDNEKQSIPFSKRIIIGKTSTHNMGIKQNFG